MIGEFLIGNYRGLKDLSLRDLNKINILQYQLLLTKKGS